MGQQAEWVMLNKGPHMVGAVRVLDDILRRMQTHKSKRRAKFRELRLAKSLLPELSLGAERHTEREPNSAWSLRQPTEF
jgi:pyruvate kinase